MKVGRCWLWWVALGITGACLSAEVRTFDLREDHAAYTPERGHGIDLGTTPTGGGPYFFSVGIAEGNWRVTVTLGDETRAGDTTIKAESRRLMLEQVRTRPGETVDRSFIVNVRTPQLEPPPPNAPGGTEVRLNDREQGVLHWDEKLTLEINGAAPAVRRIRIEPAPEVVTVFLAGDSTVTDQPYEPGASWGQMLPRFFQPTVAVANHAESGETLKSFLTGLRLDKLMGALKPGDYVFLQFGHNDSKAQWPQTYVEAGTTYDAYLRVYVAEVRRRGGHPVLVTSVHRRSFDPEGRVRNTHGAYLEAVRAMAALENVPIVDLAEASAILYEALGPATAPQAFSNGGRDATHHNNYGAYQLARCVVQGIRQAHLPLANHLAPEVEPFDPARPDPVEDFVLAPSPQRTTLAPRGD